jgi:ribosomal 50S subunit-recycling heat shock protein
MNSATTKRALGFLLLFPLLSVVAAAQESQQQSPPASHQVVSGKIKLNGKNVAPGFAVATGDMVETAKGSSAVVSLGKLGRVEALPATKMKVSFDDVSMSIELQSGGARVSKAEGVTAKVVTKDAEVVAITPLAALFTVDTECGNTVAAAHNASIELRTGADSQLISPGSEHAKGTQRRGCKARTKVTVEK